jgi:hypothetical protein
LLSVAVISLTVVPDVYSVESSTFIATLALLKASSMSLVKIEKARGLDSCSGEFLIVPGLCWRLPLKNTLCVLFDRYLYIYNIVGGVKP